jgi:sulfatase maturation enzyme AslB (radical SAM superfamily)
LCSLRTGKTGIHPAKSLNQSRTSQSTAVSIWSIHESGVRGIEVPHVLEMNFNKLRNHIMSARQNYTVTTFDVELTNYCNADCIMCPRDELKRPKGYMERQTFDLIVDKINELKIRYVVLSGFGEPLLNPSAISFIKILKSETNCSVELNSNGGLLNKELIDKIIISGVDAINLNINAITEDNYKAIVSQIDFNTLVSNVEYLTSENKSNKNSIDIRVQTTLVEKTANDFFDFWFERGVDKIFVQSCNNRAGHLNDKLLFHNIPQPHIPFAQRYCNLILFVAWNQEVFPCSHDLHGKYKLGNITDINASWLNKKKIKLCQDCNLSLIREVSNVGVR